MRFPQLNKLQKEYNLSVRWINNLCIEGRIPGAIKIRSYWVITEDVEKPKDGHIIAGRYIK